MGALVLSDLSWSYPLIFKARTGMSKDSLVLRTSLVATVILSQSVPPTPVAPQFTPPSQREKVRLVSMRCYTEQSKTYMINLIVIRRLDKKQEKEFIFLSI